MKTLAYLLYGGRREYALELTYSVASAVRFLEQANPADVRILLITDADGARPDLPIDHLVYSPEQFVAWTGNGAHRHAAKIEALKWAAEQTSGAIALVDTDTYFLAHPDALFAQIAPGRSVMHAHEPPIGALDYWRPLLDVAPPEVEGYPIGPDTPMNNSGVIGIDAGDAGMLDEALRLLKRLHVISPVFAIEQMAITNVLMRHTQVGVASDIVRHYWGGYERRFIHAALHRAMPVLDRDAFNRLVADFRVYGFPRKRLSDQLWARARGAIGGWSGDYRFAYLAYRSALSSKDSMERATWAEIAAESLRNAAVSDERLVRDFPKLAALQASRTA